MHSRSDYYRHQIAALQSCMTWQHGHHIETLPVEPRPSSNPYPVVVAGPSPVCREIWSYEKMLLMQEQKERH